MFVRVRSGRLFAAVIALISAAAFALMVAGEAAAASLYTGPGSRPGPSILYQPPAVAPQLTNGGVWRAPPILVSGATAYRQSEFLYQDWLYDDHGAHEAPDPNDPRSSGDLFSKPDGTYTYPTDPRYHNNAADLVEFRVRPLPGATAFRTTLNTLTNPSQIAFSIAIGGTPGQVHPFPDGANVTAPANLFLTVHQAGSKLVADLVHASTGAPVSGPAPTVTVDLAQRLSGVTDNSALPTTGPINRILASHFEPAQGADYSSECGLNGSTNPASCQAEYDGRLQPYTIYVPSGPAPTAGWGLTLL